MGTVPGEVCYKLCQFCFKYNATGPSRRLRNCCYLLWSLHHDHICRDCIMEIAQGQRRWDGVPKIPKDTTSQAVDEHPKTERRGDSAEVNRSEETRKVITAVSPRDYEWLPGEDLYEPLEETFRMQNEDVGIEYSTDRGDLSPTAPYEPMALPSQAGPPPPSECQNCSTGFMQGFTEQHWEDHLRQPSEDTVPRTTPTRLQDLAETWYAETLSKRRGP